MALLKINQRDRVRASLQLFVRHLHIPLLELVFLNFGLNFDKKLSMFHAHDHACFACLTKRPLSNWTDHALTLSLFVPPETAA